MNKQGIYHIPEAPYAYGIDRDTLYLKIRTARNDTDLMIVCCKDRYDFNKPFKEYEMLKIDGSELFDFYEINIKNTRKRYRYYFKFRDRKGNWYYYNERGVLDKDPLEGQPFQMPYLCEGDLHEEVAWAAEGVVYQIFPDRFCNGNRALDPPSVQPWGTRVRKDSFFGGDLKGITGKLGYLKKLGATMLYLTPVFESGSSHRYNTRNYYEIDPYLGTREDFKDLVDSAHARGIRIILDGVFNHTGDDFFAFQDVLRRGKESPYADWYYIKNYPADQKKVNYLTFGERIANMPKLRMSCKEVRDYFVEVGRYWIREFGIDGWRLDVCDEVDHMFWKEFYRGVKETRTDVLVVGEIMHGNTAFLSGDEMDGTMNYPFREIVKDFFADGYIDAPSLRDGLALRRHGCMNSISRHMFNLLDSHDTERFIKEGDAGIRDFKLASVLQFTYIGIPYIFYGDEIGLTGGPDPDCRRSMVWEEEKQNRELFDHIKKLAAIRKKQKALVYGTINTLYCRGNVWIFSRSYKKEEILVLLNNDGCKGFHYMLEGTFHDLYEVCNKAVTGRITLKPKSFRVLKRTVQ